jgi:hypothetical protein
MSATTVRPDQLKSASLSNTQIAADAAIALSKLATDPLARANHTGTQAQSTVVDLVSDLAAKAATSYVDSAIAAAKLNLGKMRRLRAATTANITIATALNNGDTLDGVTLATGDLVLVKNQTAPEENGVYEVAASPDRFVEMDAFNDYPGLLVVVTEGTANGDTLWFCPTNAGGVLDTDGITFTQLSFDAGASFADSETPGGTVNGSNDEFTLANTPVAGSLHLFVNGIRQRPGSGNDYTISGGTITFESGAIPQTNDVLLADYRY